MDHSKFIASIQKEEFISSFKSSANYYIQQQSLNYMCMMKHRILWISILTSEIRKSQPLVGQDGEFHAAVTYSKSCKFHAESTPVMKSFYEVYF